MRKRFALCVIVPLLWTSACLLKETTHTFYLEPDGTVTWRVLEEDVRSSETKPGERLAEELEFVRAVGSREHTTIAGMEMLGATRISSYFLRDRRPYTLFTEGELTSIGQLGQAVLDQLGLPGHAQETTVGEWSRFLMVIDTHRVEEEVYGLDDSPALDLLMDAEVVRLLLTQGRFLDALGFELIDESSAAVPIEYSEEDVAANGGLVVYCLSWTTSPWIDDEELQRYEPPISCQVPPEDR